MVVEFDDATICVLLLLPSRNSVASLYCVSIWRRKMLVAHEKRYRTGIPLCMNVAIENHKRELIDKLEMLFIRNSD